MNPRSYTHRLLTTLALAMVLLAAPALAQRRGGGGGTPGAPPPPTNRLGILTMGLTLSDDQKKQVESTLDAEYKSAAPLRDALTKSRLALGTALQTKKSPTELDEATKTYAQHASAMAQAEVKALANVMKIFTEE